MQRFFRQLFCVLSLAGSSWNITSAQWIEPFDFRDMVVSLAAVDDKLFVGTQNVGLYRSSDNGASWQMVIGNGGGMALAVASKTLYSGVYTLGHSYIECSTDLGDNWIRIDSALDISAPNKFLHTLTSNGNALFAGITGDRIFRTTDNGIRWEAVSDCYSAYCIIPFNDLLIASSGMKGIYLSTDNGTSWSLVNSTYAFFTMMAKGNGLFGGDISKGVYISTDNGTSWTESNRGIGNHEILSFALNGDTIFAGSRTDVYASTNDGASWSTIGFPGGDARQLLVCGNYLFAGGQGGFWRCPLSSIVVGVRPESTHRPSHLVLMQNYPNPFNPLTNITFSLPTGLFTRLKIIDIRGKEVATPISQYLQEGVHNCQFNASELPTGVYFFQLQAENNTVTRKALLIK